MQKSSKELFKQQKEQSEQTQKEISDDLNEFNEQMQESSGKCYEQYGYATAR